MKRNPIDFDDIDWPETRLWSRRYQVEFDTTDIIGGSACGYPQRVLDYGGPVAVYQDCIEKKVTWRKLLGYEERVYNPNIIWA